MILRGKQKIVSDTANGVLVNKIRSERKVVVIRQVVIKSRYMTSLCEKVLYRSVR